MGRSLPTRHTHKVAPIVPTILRRGDSQESVGEPRQASSGAPSQASGGATSQSSGGATSQPPCGATLAVTPLQRELEACKLSLATMNKKMVAAASAGQWYSDDPLNYFHVFSWASAVVESTEQMKSTHPNVAKPLASKFHDVLSNLMMNHRCYEYVDKFSQLFDRLILCGGEPSPAHACIAAVCSTKLTQVKMNLQMVNFQVRCAFESSELMKDYIESTCRLQFEKAATVDLAERLCILKKLKANPGINTALAADVSMALTVFDESLLVVMLLCV